MAWLRRLLSKAGRVKEVTFLMLPRATANLEVDDGGVVRRVRGSTREEI
jgi:hypothetical protein